ncbi:hypothetical protein TWF696_007634 [Orbilia brochopaga]|uniref:Fe2OG dioxygenase domain-containing protein n=1 Tax=Orbilia brochopaga TaxID=3140254 RepID=A0AAV9UQ78_9PEZI
MDARMLIDGTKIDVVDLEMISLKGLESGDAEEMAKLLSGAQTTGMFHLDFRGSQFGDVLWERVGEVYYASEKYFDQEPGIKQMDVRSDQAPSQDKGYKFCETDETFEMAYDELVKGDLKLPEILHYSKHTMKCFSEICHDATLTMLRSLSSSVSAKSPFEHSHSKTQLSDSGLKLVYEPCVEQKAQVVENKHTDGGTLTVLFYNDWGLHVKLRDGSWGFVEPIEGCAVVNVADWLEWMSGGQLRSPLHRVTQPMDGFRKRYFLSYFLRPGHTSQNMHH